MIGKEMYFVEIFKEDKFYTCIDGDKRKKGIIGYCHNMIHLGCITPKLMEEHGCIEKNCKYFSKYNDKPYWVQKENYKEKKKISLDKKRRKDELHKQRELLIINTTKDIGGFKIRNIEYGKDGLIIINYYSCAKVELDEIKEKLVDQLKMRIRFKRIKMDNKISSKIIYANEPEKQIISKKEERKSRYNKILEHTIENQHEIITSNRCGCCFCLNIFDSGEIVEYTKKENTLFLTAVCPRCSNTVLLPENDEYILDKKLLNELKNYMFK